jgi:hypothetical protein
MKLDIINSQNQVIGETMATKGLPTSQGIIVAVQAQTVSINVDDQLDGKGSLTFPPHEINVPYQTLTVEQLSNAMIDNTVDTRIDDALRLLQYLDVAQAVHVIRRISINQAFSMQGTEKAQLNAASTCMSDHSTLLAIATLTKR